MTDLEETARVQVELLRKARQHIMNGWRQGAYDDGIDCCAVGALLRVTNEEQMFASLQGLLNHAYPVNAHK